MNDRTLSITILEKDRGVWIESEVQDSGLREVSGSLLQTGLRSPASYTPGPPGTQEPKEMSKLYTSRLDVQRQATKLVPPLKYLPYREGLQ